MAAAKKLGPVDRIRICRRAGRSIDMGLGRMAVGRSSSLGSYRPALNLGNLGRSPRSIWPHLPGETVGSVWKINADLLEFVTASQATVESAA